MNKFGRELMMALMKRLPNSMDYVWSSRIEGAVELREMTTGHARVVIIIDCETDAKTIAPILDAIVRFIKSNEYFRRSNYSVFLWRDETFLPLSPLYVSAFGLRGHLEKIAEYNNASGSWENFKERYKPYKKAGQAILITTAEKVAQLSEMRTIRANNLLLLYPRGDESEQKKTAAGIPCIAYEGAFLGDRGEGI